MGVSVCLRVKLALLFSWGCFGRLAGASDGKLASDWHSHGFSRWPFTQKAFSGPALDFSRSLLNTLQPLPPSQHLFVCVCVLVLSPVWSDVFPTQQPSFLLKMCFYCVHVFNVGVLGEKSVWNISIPVMLCFCVCVCVTLVLSAASQSVLLRSTSVVRDGDIQQESQGSQSVQEKVWKSCD